MPLHYHCLFSALGRRPISGHRKTSAEQDRHVRARACDTVHRSAHFNGLLGIAQLPKKLPLDDAGFTPLFTAMLGGMTLAA